MNKESRERDIADAIKDYNKTHHLCGETLPQTVEVYRIKVISTFLRAGVPLSKIACFRELLEENGLRLTDRRHIFDYIPFIFEEEEACIKNELKEKDVSVSYDGTTRLGEASAIVVRYVDNTFCIHQRLVRVRLLTKSLCAEELAREIINILSITYSIRPNNVIGMMRDGASVNGAAIRFIKVVYPYLVDISCYSHALNRVGDHFEAPHLAEFTTLWMSLFSHSSQTKFLWKSQTGKAMQTYSSTRWWSKWQVQKSILET